MSTSHEHDRHRRTRRRARRADGGAARRPGLRRLEGTVLRAERRRLGRSRAGLERHGRQAARPRRAADVGRGRRRSHRLRARTRAAAQHQGRRPQHRRDGDRRGRPDPRHVPDARGRRSIPTPGSRTSGRLPAPGRRPRHAGARPRDRARLRLRGRRRRPDARRRARLSDAPVRLDGRQPRGGRDRDRRRRDPDRQPRRERRSVLGAPGRGRQPRRRHPVHVPRCTRSVRRSTAGSSRGLSSAPTRSSGPTGRSRPRRRAS